VDRGIHFNLGEQSGLFDLEGFSHGKVQVGDIPEGIEHPGEYIIDFLFLHDRLLDRVLGRSVGSVAAVDG